MNAAELLAPFLESERGRLGFNSYKEQGGFLFATDGKIMARLPDDGSAPHQELKVDCATLFASYVRRDPTVDASSIEITTKKCEECGGRGKSDGECAGCDGRGECSKCGHDCDDCQGTGRDGTEGDDCLCCDGVGRQSEEVKLLGMTIAGRYAALLKQMNAKIGVAAASALTAYWFVTADGVEGICMKVYEHGAPK